MPAHAHLPCRSRVSLESRYGMWRDRPSTSALITFPWADRDRLILFASFSLFARRQKNKRSFDRKSEAAKGGRRGRMHASDVGFDVKAGRFFRSSDTISVCKKKKT